MKNKDKDSFIKNYMKKISLSKQLAIMMASVFVPVIIFFLVLIALVAAQNSRYSKMLRNVTVAGEFGMDFKDNIDLNMYYYIIGNPAVTEVPKQEVERAKGIVKRLEISTKDPLNIQLLKKIDTLCTSLEQGMDIIRQKELYDEKMYELENNIYVLTDMIEESIREYAYRESISLEELQKNTAAITDKIIAVFGVCIFLLLLTLTVFAVRYITRLEKSINKMCKNVKEIGGGNFNITHVEPYSSDIKVLSDGFDMMADRLKSLMEKIRAEQNALYQTELMLMQAQINPHFLYNTLDTIIWLAEDGKNREVIDMVQSLSTFFRTSLSKGRDIVTVGEAISHIRSYLEIQHVRYSDIMEYSINVDEDIYEYEIPKLTLQPLVENSLYHGIKNKRGGGKIVVTGRMEKGLIVIRVEDNGAGMDGERLNSLKQSLTQKNSIGFGVKNVNERIRLYYGEEYGLEFESSPGKGTVAVLTIPAVKKSLGTALKSGNDLGDEQ